MREHFFSCSGICKGMIPVDGNEHIINRSWGTWKQWDRFG